MHAGDRAKLTPQPPLLGAVEVGGDRSQPRQMDRVAATNSCAKRDRAKDMVLFDRVREQESYEGTEIGDHYRLSSGFLRARKLLARYGPEAADPSTRNVASSA